MSDLTEWQEAAEAAGTITVAELDAWAQKYREARMAYELAKKMASEAHSIYEEVEGKFIEAMDQAGKKKWVVAGMGLLGFKVKMSVTTPKTIQQKQAYAKWLEEQGGKVLFWEKFGINSNTLNSDYNHEYAEFCRKVEEKILPAGSQFSVPGIDPPTATRSLAILSKEK